MSVRSPEEFVEDLEKMRYATGLPFDRFWINWFRRKAGKTPLRLRQVERDLDGITRSR